MLDQVVNGETGEVKEEQVVDGDNIKTVVDVKEEKVEKQEETKEGFLQGLKERFFGKKEEETKDDDSSGLKTVEEDVDEAFTQAALKAEWSDEDIVEFAKNYTNAELKALIPFMSVEKEEKEEVKEEIKADKVLEEVKLEDKNLDAIVQQVSKTLDAKYQEKIDQLEKRLGKVDQDRSVQEAQRFQTTADNFFDRTSKDFPVFGSTKELMRFPEGTLQAGKLVPAGAAFEARNAVWKTAAAFHTMGNDWESSLKEALDWYKGKSMEKDIHNKVIKDLKSNEKRLSPKRTEHKTEKKYANEQDEKADIVRMAAQSAGVKGV